MRSVNDDIPTMRSIRFCFLVVLCIWTTLAFGPFADVSAQELQPAVKADLLKLEIVQMYSENRNAELLALIDDYDRLLASGIEVPSPLRLIEAKSAATLGSHTRAYCALQDYLNVADHADSGYAEALGLYRSYERAAKLEGQAHATDQSIRCMERRAIHASLKVNDSGPSTVSSDPANSDPTAQGSVVFYVPKVRFFGSAIGYRVREGNKEFALLKNGNHIQVQLFAGPHTFTVINMDNGEVREHLEVQVIANQTTYVRCWYTSDSNYAQVHMSPSDTATYEKMRTQPVKQ